MDNIEYKGRDEKTKTAYYDFNHTKRDSTLDKRKFLEDIIESMNLKYNYEEIFKKNATKLDELQENIRTPEKKLKIEKHVLDGKVKQADNYNQPQRHVDDNAFENLDDVINRDNQKGPIKDGPKGLADREIDLWKSVDMKSPTSFDKNENLVKSREMPSYMKRDLWLDSDENRISVRLKSTKFVGEETTHTESMATSGTQKRILYLTVGE